MDKGSVLAAVEAKMRDVPGVLSVHFLDDELKAQIQHYEKIAEKNGAAGGLMPYKNRGVWAVLERDVSLVLVCEHELVLDCDLHGIVYMTDPSGQILGEYLAPGRREQVKKENPNVYFMSEDFVMYPDRSPAGEPFFLLDEMPIRDLDGIEGVTNATSGSMTTLSDDVVRNLLGFTGPKRWTHMVGFDLGPMQRSNSGL